jgi:hypothetical protein
MIALSGTVLVVYQIYAAEHDPFFPPEVMLAFFQNKSFKSYTFLDQFLVICTAFCGLMV